MRIRHLNNNVKADRLPKRNANRNLLNISGTGSQMMHFNSEKLSSEIKFNNMSVGSSLYVNYESSDRLSSPTISWSKPVTAAEWVERNSGKLLKYAGQYIAVTHSGIVARSNDFNDVYAKSKQKGIMNPLVFKVPKPSEHSKIVTARES